eukprot:Hpha_TRINITY_DN17136_c0_g1::TRINITY_DN17136_c0_g1_i1::g.146851::m.146851
MPPAGMPPRPGGPVPGETLPTPKEQTPKEQISMLMPVVTAPSVASSPVEHVSKPPTTEMSRATEGSVRARAAMNLQLQPIPEQVSNEYTMEQLRSNEVMTRMLREGAEEHPDDIASIASSATLYRSDQPSSAFGDSVRRDFDPPPAGDLPRSPDFAAYLGSDLRRHMFPAQVLRTAFDELACQGNRITVNTLCTYFHVLLEKPLSEWEAAKMLSAIKPLGWKTGIKEEEFMRLFLVLAGKPYKAPETHFLDVAELPWGEEEDKEPPPEVNIRQLSRHITHADAHVYSRHTRVVLPAGQKKPSSSYKKKKEKKDKDKDTSGKSQAYAGKSPRQVNLSPPGTVSARKFSPVARADRGRERGRDRSPHNPGVRKASKRPPDPQIVQRPPEPPIDTPSSTTSFGTSMTVTPCLRRKEEGDVWQ